MVKKDMVNHPEIYFPLKVFVCNLCWLVQVDEIEKAENIFNEEYTYFSSFSKSWLAHAKEYVDFMVTRFKFNQNSLIVEIASNDGYLLQYFNEKNIPVLGIEPTANTAKVAKEKGINNWWSLENSDRKNKRFSILSPNNKIINFGLFPYKGKGTYIDHNDDKIKELQSEIKSLNSKLDMIINLLQK
jgi:hypothetical protein